MAPRPRRPLGGMLGKAWTLNRTSDLDKVRQGFPVPLHTSCWLYMSFWIVLWNCNMHHSAKHINGFESTGYEVLHF